MKKGFTLIELIITIGFIAIVGTIVVANMGNTLYEQQSGFFDLFKSVIENAACTYIELKAFQETYGVDRKSVCKTAVGCKVIVDDLLNAGLLEEKDLKNPKTQDYISVKTEIKISYPSGVKTCVYQG